jgi:hypothetical protein
VFAQNESTDEVQIRGVKNARTACERSSVWIERGAELSVVKESLIDKRLADIQNLANSLDIIPQLTM